MKLFFCPVQRDFYRTKLEEVLEESYSEALFKVRAGLAVPIKSQEKI
jgi:hypothetical protein